MTTWTARRETLTGLPALTSEALVTILRTTPPGVLAARFVSGDLDRASRATGYDLATWWCTIVDGVLIAFARFDERTRRVAEFVACLESGREDEAMARRRLSVLPADAIVLCRGDYAEG